MEAAKELLPYLVEKQFMCMHYYFKACGLATISLHFDSLKNKIWRKSVLSCMYNVCIIIALILMEYYGTADHLNFLMDNQPNFRGMVNRSRDELCVGFVIVVLSYLCLKQGEMIVIMNKMHEIEQNLIAVGSSTGVDKNNPSYAIIYIFTAHLLIYVSRLTIFSPLFNFFPLHLSSLFSSLLILDSFALLYAVLLLFVRRLFRFTNDLLYAYLTRYVSDNHQIVIENNYQDLFRLSIAHSSLCKISKKLSQISSLPALLYILCVFARSTVNFYNILVDCIWNPDNHAIGFRLSIAFDGIYSLFYMVLLTYYVTCTTDESKRTREIIQDNMRHLTVESTMRGQLTQFNRCLYEGTVSFNVCNIFRLDNTLLISMAGSITSYLVILIQFYAAKKK